MLAMCTNPHALCIISQYLRTQRPLIISRAGNDKRLDSLGQILRSIAVTGPALMQASPQD